MAIPWVQQGYIYLGGKYYNEIDGTRLDSPASVAWLESVSSFRFEPEVNNNKPYTVRKEAGKGGDYWYGYRKQDGKLRKKYIGKSSEINTAKLEEIAEALNTPPQPRVTEATERNDQVVTDKVADQVTIDRLTAVELQVQALQESLEALRGELPGKFAEGDSSELPNSNAEVTDEKLQIDLGNLKAENEALKVNYAALLESSTVVADNLRKRVRESEARLEIERADREQLETELADLKQKSATASQDLPEAADLLNRLKAKRKKSAVTLADVEALLEMIKR